MLFSVMVPVLSTHSTLTRASVSMLRISCSSTFFWASLIELTASATLASRYNPSGIIPITAATIDTMLSRNVSWLKKNPWTNSRVPIGIKAIPTNLTSLSRERIISDFSPFLIALALKTTISSNTKSSESMDVIFPSRITRACGALSMFSFSSTFFARTSWMIPIRVLMMTTGIKVRLRKDPTRQTNTASTVKIKLKYVNTFS